MDKLVTVYSTSGCVDCDKVKQFLTEEGVEFEVKDVMKSEEAQQEVEKLGFMGIPITVVGDQAVKGFTPEFRELISQIK